MYIYVYDCISNMYMCMSTCGWSLLRVQASLAGSLTWPNACHSFAPMCIWRMWAATVPAVAWKSSRTTRKFIDESLVLDKVLTVIDRVLQLSKRFWQFLLGFDMRLWNFDAGWRMQPHDLCVLWRALLLALWKTSYRQNGHLTSM